MGSAPHVIGVEFGWRLLKYVEGSHFVVWGGNGAPQDSARMVAPIEQALSQ